MADSSAELLYLFRHQVLRDGMYQLLLPSERARLHLMALGTYGPIDGNLVVARELAFHAAGALADGNGLTDAQHKAVRATYLAHLRSWAELANGAYQHAEEAQAWAGVATHPDVRPEDAVEARLRACAALSSAGSYRSALRELDLSIELLKEMQPCRLHAAERVSRARVLAILGEAADAEQCARAAIAQAEALSNKELLADALEVLGSGLERQGRLDESLQLFQRATGLLGSVKQLVPRTLLRVGYASILRESGRNEEALEQARIAFESLQVAQHPRLYVHALLRYCMSLSDTGNDTKAEQLYREALPIAREHGLKLSYSALLGNLANLYSDRDQDYQRAERLLIEALPIHREAGALSGLALCLNNLGSVWFNEGRLKAAISALRASRREAARASYRLLEGRAACTEGRALLLLGEVENGCAAISHGVACLEGRDQGRFMLEFGEMSLLRARLVRAENGSILQSARETLARMRALAGSEDNAEKWLEEVKSIVDELERAEAEGRRPLLVAGHNPRSLTRQQCAALLDILGKLVAPEIRAVLKECAGSETTPAWDAPAPAALLA